jgi:hypothetical protein
MAERNLALGAAESRKILSASALANIPVGLCVPLLENNQQMILGTLTVESALVIALLAPMPPVIWG